MLNTKFKIVDTVFVKRLITALSSLESPPQSYSIDFVVGKHKIIGDVPIAARHLHNLENDLGLELHEIQTRYINGDISLHEKTSVEQQFRTLKNQCDAVYTLKWAFIHEANPFVAPEFKTLVVLENWKVAGIREVTPK